MSRSTVDVMVVDDCAVLLPAYRRALERGGYRVVTYANGWEALQALDLGVRPALIVTDLEMPVMTGAELLTTVRRRFGAIPTVLNSGSATGQSVASDLGIPYQEKLSAAEMVLCVNQQLPNGGSI